MKLNVWSVAVACAAFALMSFCVSKNAIKYNKDVAVINTSSIVKARGYMGNTPVKIFVRNNKIVKIESLPNRFVGKSVDEASAMKVDGVSGATYSSKALIQNVKGGLKYYKDNKKSK